MFFNSTSTGAPDAFIWDFGDGSPTVEAFEPAHTYTEAGEYLVTLIAMDSLTCNLADTTYLPITIGQADPITAEQQQAISEFVRGGHGLAVAHSGVDALYGWDEYREMVGGGLFQEHPWTQEVQINVEDASNPAVAHLAPDFRLRDEIYVLDENPRENVQVLMSLDLASTGAAAGSADHPLSWIRRHGEGRVFVTVLGHFGEVWENPAYQQHVLQGLRIAAGRLEADFGG